MIIFGTTLFYTIIMVLQFHYGIRVYRIQGLSIDSRTKPKECWGGVTAKEYWVWRGCIGKNPCPTSDR